MSKESRRARRRQQREQSKQGAGVSSPRAAGLSRWFWGVAGTVVVLITIVALTQSSGWSGDDTPPSAGHGAQQGSHPAKPPLKLTPRMRGEVVREYPHSPLAFTQGLLWHEGHLIEGTGQRRESRLRKVVLETGESVPGFDRAIPESERFGEGVTLLGDKIYQLTWTSGVGYVYDAKTFEHIHTFHYPEPGKAYPKQGWGLTHDGTDLIMSDGSHIIYFLDPKTLTQKRSIQVFDGNGSAIRNLNELEYVQGEIWANVWTTDHLVRINPATGKWLGWIDLSALKARGVGVGADVLNGIAFDPATQRIFVTGKRWSKLFEIRLVPE